MSARILVPTSCALVLAILLLGCDRGDDSAKVSVTPHALPGEARLGDAERQQILEAVFQTWEAADPVLEAAAENAEQLRVAIGNLLQAPTANTLLAAQNQWRETALAYQPFSVYGSLAELQPEQFHQLKQLVFTIAARPIQPGYLDNFGPYTYSGLVHDIGIAITPETLREQHGMTDTHDAALGLYALQFMLFGYSDTEPREAGDFLPQELTTEQQQQGFKSAEELPKNRRRQLVHTQAQLLVEDIQRLHQLWQPNTEGSIYDAFTAYLPLQQHSLLVRAARLELSEIITELGKYHAAPESGVTAQAVEQTFDTGDTSFAERIPMAFLATRLQQLYGSAQTLRMNEELQKNLKRGHQLLAQLKSEKAAKDATESVIATLTQTLDLMTAEDAVK